MENIAITTTTDLQTLTTLVAKAIIKETMPVKDRITQREAERRYGKRWMEKAKAAGVHCNYSGSRVIYSIHELDCYEASCGIPREPQDTGGTKRKVGRPRRQV